MNDFRGQVVTALEACTFLSDVEYSWFGQPSGSLPPSIHARLAPDEARRYTLLRLQEQLYNDFYCRGGAEPQRRVSPHVLAGASTLVEALSAANSGAGPWERGWEAEAVDGEHVVVSRNGLRMWAPAADCVPEGGASLTSGMKVRVRLPKELLSMSPGFYLARGDLDLADVARPSLRVYWNLSAAGAPAFISLITSGLNLAAIPFQTKVLNHPGLYFRCDAAVVYLPRAEFRPMATFIQEVASHLRGHLRSKTPAFTKRLDDGVGLAEDPGDLGESFGSHRCRLLAEGLVAAHDRDATEIDGRLKVVAETFARAGIDLERPYLSPGSVDDYRLRAE